MTPASCSLKSRRWVDPLSRHYPVFDSPDPAINQATAWAINRVGGHLRVDPADPDRSAWGIQDFEALRDDARRWARVRGQNVIDAEDFLGEMVGGLWGARLDGAGGRLELAPFVPPGWRRMAVRRLRAHRTLVDFETRFRSEWLTLKLAVMFGPPIAVAVGASSGIAVAGVTVDEVPLGGPRAIFTASGEHEVMLFLG